MGNQTDYFNKIGYKPKYFIGDRVFGKWNKIPFIGSVGNDTLVNLDEGPRISILLDLPIIVDKKIHNIIIVKHKDITPLINYEEHTPRNSGSERKTKGKANTSADLQVLPTAKLEVARKTKRSQKTNKGV